MGAGLVQGEHLSVDGSFILANASTGSRIPREQLAEVAQVKRTEIVAILKKGKSFYCEQVPEGKPWHGLWRFPDFDPAKMTRGETLAKIKYGITKYAVTMEAVTATWKGHEPASASVRYLTAEEVSALAFAAPHRKLANTLKKGILSS